MSRRAQRYADVARNAVSNYVLQGAQALYFMLLTPYVVRRVGAEDYGLWAIAVSTVGLLGLLDLGLALSVVKYVGRTLATRDAEDRSAWVSTIFAAYVGLGALIVGLGALVGLWAETLFSLAPRQVSTARWVFFLVGARVGLTLPLSVFKGALVGYQKAHLSNACSLFGLALSAASIVAALEAGYGLPGVAVAYLGSQLLSQSAVAFVAHRAIDDLSIGWRRVERARLFEALRFSGSALLATTSSLIMHRFDTVIVQRFCAAALVAPYYIAMRMAEMLVLFIKPLINALSPIVPELAHLGDRRQLRAVLLRASKLALLLVAPIVATLLVHGPALMRWWLGNAFGAGGPILRVLVVAAVATILQANISNVLTLAGQHRFVGKAMVLQAAVNVAASLLLARFFGAVGVALATLLTVVVVDCALMIRHALRAYDISAWQYLSRVLLPAGLASAPFVLALIASASLVARGGLGTVCAAGLLGAAIYLPSAWFVGLDGNERAEVRAQLRRRRQRRQVACPSETR